jgi:hypothetical protein
VHKSILDTILTTCCWKERPKVLIHTGLLHDLGSSRLHFLSSKDPVQASPHLTIPRDRVIESCTGQGVTLVSLLLFELLMVCYLWLESEPLKASQYPPPGSSFQGPGSTPPLDRPNTLSPFHQLPLLGRPLICRTVRVTTTTIVSAVPGTLSCG